VLIGIANRIILQNDLSHGARVDQLAQKAFSDMAKVIDCDPRHGCISFIGRCRPILSIKACRDIQFNDANGGSMNAAIRRRSAE
jgi:hypothetical protein